MKEIKYVSAISSNCTIIINVIEVYKINLLYDDTLIVNYTRTKSAEFQLYAIDNILRP